MTEVVAWALSAGEPLELIGAGSKRGLGRPVQATHRLDLSGLSGIGLYEPAELVLSAAAGTPVAEIEVVLAERRQQLAFEPPDLGPLYDVPSGRATIGGIIACNLSGPRRIKAGAARDHFLGFSGVSGRGEAFKAGGRVVKNVTGYDLCKLLAGSYGTLAALTEVTIKVLPAPGKIRTVLLIGLDDATAIQAMTRALQSSHEPSAVAHLPRDIAAASSVEHVERGGGPVTALRVEGPGPSAIWRCAALRREMADLDAHMEELHTRNSTVLWREVRDATVWVASGGHGPALPAVWRLSVPPAAGALVTAQIADTIGSFRYFYDWGGGLIWLALPPRLDAGAAPIRAAATRHGGHATLFRASDDIRVSVPVLQPEPESLAALARRVKESFDPQRILNPGRMAASL